MAGTSPHTTRLVQARLEERLRRAPAPEIPSVPRDSEIPLSFGQERLWFLAQYEPRSYAYNCPEAIHLKGDLRVEPLERALTEIVRRHEALRTTFGSKGGRAVQHIAPAGTIPLPVVDLSTAGDPQAEVERIATREAQALFDLTRGPLVRARLLRLSPDEHILLWISHHAVYDGWSFGVFLGELSELYGAFAEGQPSPLPELRTQFADFAAWERAERQGAQHDEALSYWRRQLGGHLPVLQLPTDRPRLVFQTYRGARLVGRLPRATLLQLKALGRREGATLFMVLLAAFQALLSRYTGQSQILVGSPIANRPRPEFERLIGFFANMLVYRGDVSDDPTFRTFLRRTHDLALEAYTNQDVPFGRLVEALHPVRDVSRSPIFQVAFALQNTPRPSRSIPGLEMKLLDVEAGLARYDLTLSMKETEEELLQRFEYNTDLFDRATIARMERHMTRLLEAVVENPDRRISEIPYLTDDEVDELVVLRNQTDSPVPRDRCVHDLVDEQARRTPNAEAIAFGSRRVTYSELTRRADALAVRLRQLGVGIETPVAVCVDRSPEMIVAMLGILKAGAAYVPIDRSSPADRVAYILADAGVEVVVADRHAAVPVTGGRPKLVVIDGKDPEPSDRGFTTSPAVLPESLAYIIYTTGSTGRPKGVQVPHRALVNFLAAMRERPGITAADTVLAITTIAFDISALEIFLPLTVGGRVVLASSADAASPRALMELLKTSSANVVQATPTTWRMLVEAGWSGQPELTILCGGESLSRHLADALLCRAREVWNMYGPTETTVWSTAGRVEPGDTPISIGRPIANTRVYVLDSGFRPVPVGVAGELFIGGLGLARGYINKPELTADKFVPDPFSSVAGSRMYRTGDLVRSLADGGIQFLGRLDNQVKIRGFRVELDGIEAVLRKHPQVRTAVVVAREDPVGQRLVAYLVPRDERPEVDELKELVRARLPSYCVPSTILFLDSLPLTENGKLDVNALPEPEPRRRDLEPAFVPARDPIERQLAEMWSELLDVNAVGMLDSFFDLGGHSLLVLRLFAWIEQQFGRSLPASTIFESPTIEHLARLLREPAASGKESCLVPLQPLGSRPPFFCVHGVGGHVLGYQTLAKLLGSDQPVLGVQLPADDREALSSIESMAARYVDEVRRAQPSGPYRLGGHSFGGMVAFEMARQLEASGETVDLLALFDTRRGDFGRGIAVWGRVSAVLENFGRLAGRQKIQYLWGKLRAVVHGRNGKNGGRVNGSGDQLDVAPQIYRAARSYVQRPYGGNAIVFRANQGLERHRGDRLDWRDLVRGGVEYLQVSAGHDEMLSVPHVYEISALLRERLELAPARANGSRLP